MVKCSICTFISFIFYKAANIETEHSQETQPATQTDVKWHVWQVDFLRETIVLVYLYDDKIPEIVFNLQFSELRYPTAIFSFTKSGHIKLLVLKGN